jgi:transcriptional regulator with XRE-family HTH domain/methylmalonyl-CoA mutase cobalamin-binding subunit
MKERNGLDVQLKNLRTRFGMTQKELAEKLNIGQTAIANYENGKRFPDENNLIKLADCFGVSIDNLIGRKESSNIQGDMTFKERGFDYIPSELKSRKYKFLDTALKSGRKGTELILDLIQDGYSEEQIMMDLIEAAMIETGNKWAEGSYNEAMEHQISATVLESILMMKSLNNSTKNGIGKFVSLTGAGENHNIGLRMISRFLEIDGWENFFLGSSVPGNSLKNFILENNIRLVLISITLNENADSACSLIRAVKSIEKPVAVAAGGAASLRNSDILLNAGTDHISSSVPETIDWVRTLKPL